MIRTAIRGALLLLALAVPAITPAMTPAMAQSERPALRATATVAGDVVRIGDLIRLGVVDEFEREEPAKNIAKRLSKEGLVERFNQKSGIFTLTRSSNGDCLYLDRKTRLCTVYAKRPDTCRNHPQVGPRPGYCAYRKKPA